MNNAVIIIIGNEILSGRTLDINANFIAKRCSNIGINIKEIRTIPDTKKIIIDVVTDCSKKYQHVFVTGGIGPTHDDITTECIAKVFKRKLVLNKKAKELLTKYYNKSKVHLNESRIKMAYLPARSELILNPISAAPGFKIKNVWVMAGVPKIMQKMFVKYVEPKIKRGKKIYTKNIDIFHPEGDIAKQLSIIQNNFLDAELGSYPFVRGKVLGTNIVIKSSKKNIVNEIYKKIKLFNN